MNQSDTLNELYTALNSAQQEMSIAKTDSDNPFFKSKYADFASIVRATRPALSSNGLCIIQTIQTESDRTFLVTRLAHKSGQWIDSKAMISPQKPDIQSFGSYITYMKRYAYSAITGVVCDDGDDDGESLMNRPAPPLLPEKMVEELAVLLEQLPNYQKDISKFLSSQGIISLRHLPEATFNKILENAKAKLEKGDE